MNSTRKTQRQWKWFQPIQLSSAGLMKEAADQDKTEVVNVTRFEAFLCGSYNVGCFQYSLRMRVIFVCLDSTLVYQFCIASIGQNVINLYSCRFFHVPISPVCFVWRLWFFLVLFRNATWESSRNENECVAWTIASLCLTGMQGMTLHRTTTICTKIGTKCSSMGEAILLASTSRYEQIMSSSVVLQVRQHCQHGHQGKNKEGHQVQFCGQGSIVCINIRLRTATKYSSAGEAALLASTSR